MRFRKVHCFETLLCQARLDFFECNIFANKIRSNCGFFSLKRTIEKLTDIGVRTIHFTGKWFALPVKL